MTRVLSWASRANFRRAVAVVIAVAAVTVTGACSSTKTTADWDHATDFSTYETFDFKPGMPFQRKEVGEIVEEMVGITLTGKGLNQVAAGDNPDLHVVLFPQMEVAGRVDWYSQGYSPWWGGWGGVMMVGTRFTDIPVGGLMIDIVDIERKRLVWRGTVDAQLKNDPVGNAKLVMKLIENTFQGFPPKYAPQ